MRAELLSICTTLPEHRVTASDTKRQVAATVPPSAAARFAQMVDISGNETRYLVLPLDDLRRLDTLGARNQASVVFPGTLNHSEVQLTPYGLRLRPPRGLGELLRRNLGAEVDAFLARHDRRRGEMAFWVIHPRNRELLDAAAAGLQLSESALAQSRAVWRRTGNVISSAVFHVLAELRDSAPPPDGALGLMIAFGAGFSCEMVLLQAGGWLCQEKTRYLA